MRTVVPETLHRDLELYNRTLLSLRRSELDPVSVGGNKCFQEFLVRSKCDRSPQVLESYTDSGPSTGAGVTTATMPSCLDSRFWYGSYPYYGVGNRTTSVTTMYPVVSTRCVRTGDIRATDSAYDTKISYLHDNGTSYGDLFDFRENVNESNNYNDSSSAVEADLR